MWTHVELWTGGVGVKNLIFFVDVINGWPLSPLQSELNAAALACVYINGQAS